MVDPRSSRPLLTLGRVHLVRVQVGYRAGPEGPVHQQFLLDLPVPEEAAPAAGDPLDESRVLAALEPVIHAGNGGAPALLAARPPLAHHLGPEPGGTGDRASSSPRAQATAAASEAWLDTRDPRLPRPDGPGGPPEASPTPREAAILRARRSVASSYGLDQDELSPSAEEHHPAENSWTVALRAAGGEGYDVVVGLVDGYAGSVRVRHRSRIEVSASVGSE